MPTSTPKGSGNGPWPCAQGLRRRQEVEAGDHPAVDRLRQDDQPVFAFLELEAEVARAARHRQRPAGRVVEPDPEGPAQAERAHLVVAGGRHLEAVGHRFAGRQVGAGRHSRRQDAAVAHRAAGQPQAEVPGAAERLDRKLVVARAQELLEQEVAAAAAVLRGVDPRPQRGAQRAFGVEQAGRFEAVERRLLGVHQEGVHAALVEIEETFALSSSWG